MHRWRRLRLASRTAAAVVTIGQLGIARPQVNAALAPGVCFDLSKPSGACFALAARGDVMYGREGTDDFGWGPAWEVGTVAFEDLRLGAGLALQVPAEPLQIVLTPGPYVRVGAQSDVGGSLRVFVGSRSYNHSGSYVAAFGLVSGLDWGFGEAQERRLIVAAHLDAMWMALPWMALISWLSE